MDSLYYYHSLRKTTVQILDLFNNIKIAKFNQNGSVNKVVKVPLRLTPKDKFTFWLFHQKKFEKRLPIMSLSLTSIEFDASRMKNSTTPITYAIDGDFMNHMNPTPYNMHYKLQIASQYITEMDQILEQILPFFDPDIFIRVALPEFNNKYNVKVILDSVAQSTTPDIPTDDYRMILWDLDFTVQSYMFKPIKNDKVIKKIIERFYINEEAFNNMRKMNVEASTVPIASFSVNADSSTGILTVTMPPSESQKLANRPGATWKLTLTNAVGASIDLVVGNINII